MKAVPVKVSQGDRQGTMAVIDEQPAQLAVRVDPARKMPNRVWITTAMISRADQPDADGKWQMIPVARFPLELN